MTLNSSRQQSHFPTDMDTMHCKSTVGKTSRNFLPVKHISRTSQTSYSSQSDIWQSDWFPTMTAHRSTLWLDNAENRDPSGKQVIQTAPWKGTTSKNRKMLNNGLLTSLANNFYLYKTKQSNSKETHTHTHTHSYTGPVLDNWTSACYALELDCGSAWLKGVLETVHAHYTYIHISRAVTLPNVAKYACCLITWLWSLWCGTPGPNPPTSIS